MRVSAAPEGVVRVLWSRGMSECISAQPLMVSVRDEFNNSVGIRRKLRYDVRLMPRHYRKRLPDLLCSVASRCKIGVPPQLVITKDWHEHILVNGGFCVPRGWRAAMGAELRCQDFERRVVFWVDLIWRSGPEGLVILTAIVGGVDSRDARNFDTVSVGETQLASSSSGSQREGAFFCGGDRARQIPTGTQLRKIAGAGRVSAFLVDGYYEPVGHEYYRRASRESEACLAGR
eukprot:IDg4328t1